MELKPFPTWEEATEEITDSRFVGHAKIPLNVTASVQDGARIMYDRLYTMLQDPSRVSVDRDRLDEIALSAEYCPSPLMKDKNKRPIVCQANNGAMPDTCIPCWIDYLTGTEAP